MSAISAITVWAVYLLNFALSVLYIRCEFGIREHWGIRCISGSHITDVPTYNCFFTHAHWNLSVLLTTTVTSWWAGWRFKLPAPRLFTQPFVQAQIKETLKAPRHWPLWREFTGDRWIPGPVTRKMFPFWWRHHVLASKDNTQNYEHAINQWLSWW